VDLATQRVAIVSGGASGIGKATVEVFSKRDFRVVVLDIDKSGANAISRGGHRNVSFTLCDVTDEDEVKESIRNVQEEHKRIDVLLNIAGAALIKPVDKTKWDEYRRIVDLNLGGTFLLCKYVVPVMKAQRSGSIVNIGSVSAYAGQAFRTLYSASKGAVVSFTKSLAWELAPFGIRVNCISPGLVETPLFRRNVEIEAEIRGIPSEELRRRKESDQAFGRFADPREVAEVAYFLASEKASFVNATDIPVDSGWLAK
jgi:NAD(P)-dependent dehydrogenase (short-subunit alcohol dehydrogenase family)